MNGCYVRQALTGLSSHDLMGMFVMLYRQLMAAVLHALAEERQCPGFIAVLQHYLLCLSAFNHLH